MRRSTRRPRLRTGAYRHSAQMTVSPLSCSSGATSVPKALGRYRIGERSLRRCGPEPISADEAHLLLTGNPADRKDAVCRVECGRALHRTDQVHVRYQAPASGRRDRGRPIQQGPRAREIPGRRDNGGQRQRDKADGAASRSAAPRAPQTLVVWLDPCPIHYLLHEPRTDREALFSPFSLFSALSALSAPLRFKMLIRSAVSTGSGTSHGDRPARRSSRRRRRPCGRGSSSRGGSSSVGRSWAARPRSRRRGRAGRRRQW